MSALASLLRHGTPLELELLLTAAGRLNLTVADQNALVAFLMTLTDDVLNLDPKFQNPFK